MRFLQCELEHLKHWRLMEARRHTKRAIEGNKIYGGGLKRLMAESLDADLSILEAEIKRRKDERMKSDD